VDVYKAYEAIEATRKLNRKNVLITRNYQKLADALHRFLKMFSSEYAKPECLRRAYKIHGGSGFMKDYACERIYRRCPYSDHL